PLLNLCFKLLVVDRVRGSLELGTLSAPLDERFDLLIVRTARVVISLSDQLVDVVEVLAERHRDPVQPVHVQSKRSVALPRLHLVQLPKQGVKPVEHLLSLLDREQRTFTQRPPYSLARPQSLRQLRRKLRQLRHGNHALPEPVGASAGDLGRRSDHQGTACPDVDVLSELARVVRGDLIPRRFAVVPVLAACGCLHLDGCVREFDSRTLQVVKPCFALGDVDIDHDQTRAAGVDHEPGETLPVFADLVRVSGVLPRCPESIFERENLSSVRIERDIQRVTRIPPLGEVRRVVSCFRHYTASLYSSYFRSAYSHVSLSPQNNPFRLKFAR